MSKKAGVQGLLGGCSFRRFSGTFQLFAGPAPRGVGWWPKTRVHRVHPRSDSTTVNQHTEGIQSRNTVDFPTSKATPLRPTWFVFRTENSMFISQQNNVRCSVLDHPIPSSQLLPLASHGFARGACSWRACLHPEFGLALLLLTLSPPEPLVCHRIIVKTFFCDHPGSSSDC